MNRFLAYFAVILVVIAIIAADPEEGSISLVFAVAMSAVAIFFFRRYTNEKEFITQIFIGALCARLVFGLIVHTFDLRTFAGPDSLGYDVIGIALSDYWLGHVNLDSSQLDTMTSLRGSGWGMNYLMGFIYLIGGKHILAAQTFCAVVGAATAPMTYFCAEKIYHNSRVAKTAAFAVAFFPAFIIWSSQLLKDGLIVFLLVATMTMILQLQKKFSLLGLSFLLFALFGLMSLRFYTFYVVVFSVVGGFVVGVESSMKATLQRLAVLGLVSIAFVYFGAVRIASLDLKTYGSLERIQLSRSDLANSESGYGSDIDVSTSEGALTALPVGFAYLMFAPFPWQFKNFRQSLTLPDVLLWWSMMPLLIYGLWYTIRHKLRANIPVLIFTFVLTMAYSMFQGNLGAAYRQRTQIQVFLMIFIAVGWSVLMEKREDKKTLEELRVKEMLRRRRAIVERSQQV
jgi:hypothetical protein